MFINLFILKTETKLLYCKEQVVVHPLFVQVFGVHFNDIYNLQTLTIYVMQEALSKYLLTLLYGSTISISLSVF